MTDQSPLLSESDFASYHHQHLFHAAGEGYFLTWFDRDLEHILDRAWNSSPSAAFALHQRMTRRIMETLVAHIPQVREHGCAPLPPWTPILDQAMVLLDVRYLPGGRFNRAYAVLTFWPWRARGGGGASGCFGCALRQGDPDTGQRDCQGRFFDVRNSI
ncbi:hypothetical protein [Desulfonatronum lacustre]|uniref:hypothetical protein n=1 Tax=Desulfonatronum lacustre TaxID=66849 RepID=UPI00048ECF37|nr:hypothetical protein [Desulfonatronum lacustre]